MQQAARHAMEIPLQVMQKALESMSLLQAMAETGSPASVSDAGVGALCARVAVRGAFLNVRINSSELEDQELAGQLIAKAEKIDAKALDFESKILAIVAERL